MKKLRTTFALCIILFWCFSTVHAQLQLGGGLTFGTGIEKLGFNLRGTYEIQDNFLVAPGVNFFFKDKSLADASTSYFSVDLDARYNLITIADEVTIYPVGGLNIFSVNNSGATNGIRFREEDGIQVGLNLGLGAQIETLTSLNYFGEFRFTVGGIDQSTITAGVLYGF
ncbi:MAG: outer membrane beta-barrel protein [Bacteroidota bacterium]